MGWLAVVKTGIVAGWIVYAGPLGSLAEGRALCERANKAFDGGCVRRFTITSTELRGQTKEWSRHHGKGSQKKREARLLFSLFSIRSRRATQASAGVKGAKGQICLGSLYLCFSSFLLLPGVCCIPPQSGIEDEEWNESSDV